MDAWVQIITAVGFPIFACLAMGYFIKVQIDQYRSDIKDMQKEHKEEIVKISESIDNNTLVIRELIDKLDKEK